MAKLQTPSTVQFSFIAQAAGSTEPPEYDGDILTVHGVTQQGLETAYAAYDDTSASFEIVMTDIRRKRDALLLETDWWGASDQTMSDAQTAYRLALRNYPATYTADNTAAWPTKP